MDESGISGSRLLEAGGDPTIPFEGMEEAFDDVALSIEVLIVAAPALSGFIRRNHDVEIASLRLIDDLIGIVSAIGNARFAINMVQQIDGDRGFMLLAFCRANLKRTALYIHGSVDFRRKPTTRSSYGVFFGPPLPPAAS